MATKKVLDASLTAVADAIRAKGETAADLTFPNGFVTAIQAIPTGGGDEWEEKYVECVEGTGHELPDGVKKIRAHFFEDDIALTSAEVAAFPAGLEEIGEKAFVNTNVSDVDLSGRNLKTIGDECFAPSGVIRVDLSNNDLRTLGDKLFYGSGSLTTINLANNPNLKAIPIQFVDAASSTSEAVTSFNVSGTPIETIGDYAFRHTSSTKFPAYSWLEGLASLKTIGIQAFKSNYSNGTHSLDLSGCTSLEEIKESAFAWAGGSGYGRWQSIKFPASLKTIGNYAFQTNPLSTIDFSDVEDLESIGQGAFVCSKYAPGTGQLDFSKCTNLKTIAYRAFYTNSNNFRIIGKITFPPSKITTIGQEAFRQAGLANQGEMTLKVGSIGANCFLGCTGITKLNLEFDETNIAPFSGCTGITEIHITNTPTTFSGNITTYPVFWNCSNVTDIYVPWSQGDIPENKFFLAAQNPTWHYDTV